MLRPLFLFLIITSSLYSSTPEACDKIIKEGIVAMNNKEHETSLELLTKAKSMAEENNWPLQLFLAINNIGANYYKMSDYGEALTNYLQAYNLAVEKLDSGKQIIVLNNIAILYYQEENYNKAEEYFYKAYSIAKSEDEKFKIGLYGINMGLVLNKKGELKSALKYLDEAIPILEKMDENMYVQAKYAKAENTFLQKDYYHAKILLEELVIESSNVQLIEQQIASLIMLSKIYKEEGDYKKALFYGTRASLQKGALESKINSYSQLFDVYSQLRDIDNAILYKDSIVIAKDSLYRLKNGALFETNRVKFEIKNYQHQLYESQRKLKNERIIFYIILSTTCILLVIVSWALYNNGIKYKQKKIIAEKNQKIKMLELEQEIESKNRKLAVKALQITSRNELIQEVIQPLADTKEIEKIPQLKKSIQQLKNHLRTEDTNQEFFSYFEEINQGFSSKLIENHPILTSNDIRFLAYIYMNLSLKEISLLFNITIDACRKRKDRICKKMNISDNSLLHRYLYGIQA